MGNKISYIESEQKRIAGIVTNKFKEYYLTGGTALSFYFAHRFSEDLDFFTQKYKKEGPGRIMNYVSKETGFDFKLEAEQNKPELIPMKVYSLELKKKYILKIDFVQDYEKNIKKMKPPRADTRGILHFFGEISPKHYPPTPRPGRASERLSSFIHGLTPVVFCEGG